MPGFPNGTDMEIIFRIHSCKSFLARMWKTDLWNLNDASLFKSPPIIPGSTDQVRYESWTENANFTFTSFQEHREHRKKNAMAIYRDLHYQNSSLLQRVWYLIFKTGVKELIFFTQWDSPGAFNPICKNSIYTNLGQHFSKEWN